MYAIEEIERIVQGVVKLLKPYDIKTGYMGEQYREVAWKDIPEYWPGYKKAIKYMEAIRVHSEIGDFPEKLFKVRAPNQTEAEYEYIKANYRQVTLPVFMDYISTMQRPFFEGNYSIDYQTEKWKDAYTNERNTLQDYAESNVTLVGNLENYMKMFVAQIKAIDANGVIAVKPKNIPVRIDDDGQAYVDNSQMFEPVPVYYSTDKKLAFKKNEYYLIHTDEQSEVMYANSLKNKGHVFEFYDDTNIWQIRQVGNYVDFKFEYFIYFEHGWGKVPVHELLGVPQALDSRHVINISPFHYAVPNLNNALVSTQFMNASKDRAMFPYLVMMGRPCDMEYKNEDGQISTCSNGEIWDSALSAMRTCPRCHGNGQVLNLGPFGGMLIPATDELNNANKITAQSAMHWVSPPTEALEFVRDCIAQDFQNAKNILHQQTSNTVVKGTENLTATGQVLDNKSMFAFVKTPSDQMFSIWEFILDAIGFMRYGPDYVKAILISPDTFDYLTDSDYVSKISEAQKAGLPPWVMHSLIFKYLSTLYYNEKERAAVFTLIINTDRIMTLSHGDMMIEVARGLVQPWEATIHVSAINLVAELVIANPNYLEQDLKAQQDQLIALAKTKPTPQLSLQEAAVQRALGA